MKLKTAVVGVGHLGRFHAQKHKMISEVELVGVCDTSADQAQRVAKELGVQPFTSLQDLLREGVQAVTVAASTPAHYALVKELLSHDVHVLVEKPIASSTREAEELCELAERRRLKLQVGHVERFNPAFQSARERITKPLFVECHRLAPFKVRSVEVDVVLDLMIHDLDVVLSLIKSDVVSVSSVGSPVLTKLLDITNARLEFANGAVANLTASRVSQSTQRKFRVFQPDQYVSIDFQSGEVNILTKTGEWKDGEIPLAHDQLSMEKGDALLSETQSFVRSVMEDQPVAVSGIDGLKALRLAEKVIADALRRLA
jgi:predicted dehydrogenase